MNEIFTMDFKGKLLVALVFMVLGFMLSVQYKTTEHQRSVHVERVQDLSERLKVMEAENKTLVKEIEKLQKNDVDNKHSLKYARMNILSGESAVAGSGIEVLLDDSKQSNKFADNPNLYIIHDEDILRVLNELRAAGAEAIAINDQRIVATSEIRCAGPTVSVNNVRSAPPYVIKAVGDPKTLTSALRLRGGVVETFEFWGIEVKITKHDDLIIPALAGGYNFTHAKVIEAKEEKK